MTKKKLLFTIVLLTSMVIIWTVSKPQKQVESPKVNSLKVNNLVFRLNDSKFTEDETTLYFTISNIDLQKAIGNDIGQLRIKFISEEGRKELIGDWSLDTSNNELWKGQVSFVGKLPQQGILIIQNLGKLKGEYRMSCKLTI